MTTTRVLMSSCWLGLSDRDTKGWSSSSNPQQYECRLSERARDVALTELREDSSGRSQALDQMHDWICKNRDLLNCRTDHSFILRFLRVKKFSVPLAQQTLLKYLNLRQSLSQLCFGLDCLEPSIASVIDSGYIFASPVRDAHGRRVIIIMAQNFDPYKFTNCDMAKAHCVTYETLLEDEENQVLGFTHVGDTKGVSAAHVTLWPPIEFTTALRWGEQSMPMRHKEIHLINIPFGVRYAYEFSRSRFSNKIRSRFMVHNSLEDLHTKVDSRCLPKEMGGEIPMRDMIEGWKRELLKKRDVLLALDRMRLLDTSGISNRTQGKPSRIGLENSITGSFRKLEVD